MFLNLRELEQRKIRFEVDLPPGEIEFDPKVRQLTPLHAEGSAELLGNALGEIRVQGRLDLRMESECDRCLETVSFPVESDFDLFYRPAPPGHIGGEEAIDPGEIEIAYYQGGGLDLSDVLREQILLSLPMQQVCREECRGICPLCGQNRNQVSCGCQPKLEDDRWSALKEI